jgi:preprotein translocase subunit SecB
MAQQDAPPPGNGGGEQGDTPQAATLAQYVKDLSVESPNAPQVFQWQVQPRIEPQFNIGIEKVADDVHEVVLKIELAVRSENGVHFLIDLSYAGLFGLRNVPEEALGPFLLIEAPRLLFPFARQIIADCTQNTGFPPILLDPVDFTAAYLARAQAEQAGQNGGGESGNGSSEGAEGQPEPGETPAS